MLDKLIIKPRKYVKKNFSPSDYGKNSLDLWLALKGVPQTNPPKWNETLKFGAGNGVEDQMLTILKDSGIVEEHYDQDFDGRIDFERKGIRITGYMDAVTLNGNPLEIKSTNNKNFFDIKKYGEGIPRENYVGQLSMYQDFLGTDMGGLFVATIDGLNYFFFRNKKVGEGLYHCGDLTKGVDIDLNAEYERFARVWDLFQKDKMPDIFEKRYKYVLKDIDWTTISKDKISKARNNKAVIGDWQVQYSNYKDYIIELQKDHLGYNDEELEYIKSKTEGYTKWT